MKIFQEHGTIHLFHCFQFAFGRDVLASMVHEVAVAQLAVNITRDLCVSIPEDVPTLVSMKDTIVSRFPTPPHKRE
eukprot:SAG11_NODE_5444_length_1558_cov_1.759424_1_plen_75_part_10